MCVCGGCDFLVFLKKNLVCDRHSSLREGASRKMVRPGTGKLVSRTGFCGYFVSKRNPLHPHTHTKTQKHSHCHTTHVMCILYLFSLLLFSLSLSLSLSFSLSLSTLSIKQQNNKNVADLRPGCSDNTLGKWGDVVCMYVCHYIMYVCMYVRM